MSDQILVTGATGTIGSHLVQTLHTNDVEFKALVRSRDNSTDLSENGVQTVIGKFEDKDSLVKAMKGVKKVFLLSPPSPDQVEHQSNVIETAAKEGVSHIVKVSALGTEPNSPISLGRWHAETETQIKASGIDFTFLHPHSFMQNMLMNIDSIKNQNAVYSSWGDGKVAIIDARDIADTAAVVLTNSGHEGKTYPLTGPEALNMNEIAKIFSEVLDETIRYIPVSHEDAHKAMLTMGLPEWLADDLVELNKIYSAGHGANVTGSTETITGEKARTFRRFVLDHSEMFK